MKTTDPQTSWIHVLFLVALSGSGGAVGIKQYERMTSPPAVEPRLQIEQARELTEALLHLRATVDRFQPSVEKLSDTVQELSRKVAVIEDRQEREGRLRR